MFIIKKLKKILTQKEKKKKTIAPGLTAQRKTTEISANFLPNYFL